MRWGRFSWSPEALIPEGSAPEAGAAPVAGLPSMLVPFFSRAGMFLEFCSGRLHWDVDTAKNRRGRVSNDLEINITVQVALDQPISECRSSQDRSRIFDSGLARLIGTAIGGYRPHDSQYQSAFSITCLWQFECLSGAGDKVLYDVQNTSVQLRAHHVRGRRLDAGYSQRNLCTTRRRAWRRRGRRPQWRRRWELFGS